MSNDAHRGSPVQPARSRRRFLSDAALIAAGLSIGCSTSADRVFAPPAVSLDLEGDDNESERLPNGDRSGIESV